MKNYLIPLFALTFGAIAGHADGSSAQVEFQAEINMEDRIKECRTFVAEMAKSNKIVLQEFDLFSSLLTKAYQDEGVLTSNDMEKILSSVEFATEKHKLQFRKNKDQTPYISHPIGVAANLMKIGKVRDPALIIAAVLHDTVEDTETTYAEIEKRFGSDVAGYVKELTDDKSLSVSERKRRQVISAAKKSPGATQIKLADKLYNLQDLFNNPPAEWSRTRIDQYYHWAQSVVDRLPAANDSLKGAVDQSIEKYWETQSQTK